MTPADEVRLTVVGSGTLLPDGGRGSASHFIEGSGARILMDCGSGTLHAMDRFAVPWADLTHLAVSHFHTDHIGDLPSLLFALKHGLPEERGDPLTVIGPRGLYQRFGHLAGAFGDHVLDPGFELVLLEMNGGERWEAPSGGFTLACHPTPHTEGSLAYRWEGAGHTVGYTGDTGPSEEVAAFLAGCDVVICECSLSDPPSADNHLSPASVAEMARIMDPELLVLTHVYPSQTPAEAARRVAEHGWDGRVEAARDGTTVRLGAGEPVLRHPGNTRLEEGSL